MSQNVGNLLFLEGKIIDLRSKSVCAVKMTVHNTTNVKKKCNIVYVHWTFTDINRKDLNA